MSKNIRIANKLMKFMEEGKYDTETLQALGIIAGYASVKHKKLEDEIRCSIASLIMDDADGRLIMFRLNIGY